MNCFAKFLAARLVSLSHALNGFAFALRTQGNIRVHIFATIVVVTLGFALGITRLEWAALTFAISIVWVAELFNTALEFLCDIVAPEKSDLVKNAKDIAAAAVLLAALGAATIGALVFWPHFSEL